MYKHIIESYIIPYLQKFNCKVKKPLDAFDCPFCQTPKSAQIVPGSYGLNCHNCNPIKTFGKIYNLVDVVKKLENKDYTDEEVYQIIRKMFDVKVKNINTRITKNGKHAIVTFMPEFKAEDIGMRIGIF